MKNAWLRKASALFLATAILAGCGGSSAETGSSSAAGAGNETTATSQMEAATGEVANTERTAATEPVDRIVIAVASSSTDVSPFGTISATRTMVQQNLYAPLFYIKAGDSLDEAKPYIGKSITAVDDYTYDIELFDNVTDSKGNPIKADDVLWSYQMCAENYMFSPYQTDVVSFEKVDDTHLRLVVNKKLPGTVETLVCDSRLSIISKDWYEKADENERMKDPACSGPYTVKEVVDGSKIVMTANDNYWKTNKDDMNPTESRNVKEIVLKVIAEEAMRSIGLETQELDYAGIGVTNLHRFYDNGQPLEGYNVHIGITTPTFSVLFMNCDENSTSVFAKSPELRRAALYAIDSEAMYLSRGYNADTAHVLKGFGNSETGGYLAKWEDEDYFDYNPEKARELIKEAGYEPGEVEIRVMTSMLAPDSTRSVMIANLEEAGFKVNNLAVEQALYMKYAFESSEWDMILQTKGFYQHVIPVWDANFNPNAWSNGSVCFTHDDKLTDLLFAAEEDPSDANLDAFNQYLKEQGICKALYEGKSIEVAQDGILKMDIGMFGFDPSASTYASDYVSAPKLAD
ncbi:MAG: ABC transporter substrate-binding protein [Solobacterium sp.]|nr:ABC transporter substrate-binding protein [Solobacterium sp.]